MFENCIIYTLEIVKYYLIIKFFLGFNIRKSIWVNILGAMGIILFSTYITFTSNNPLFVFMLFVLFEMFILLKEKPLTIVLSTIWMVCVVGMLDDMFIVGVEVVTKNLDVGNSWIECVGVSLTTLFVILIVIVIKKYTRGENVHIAKVYYIYFTILTAVEGMLIELLQVYLEKEIGNDYYGLVIVCMLVMVVNIVIVMFLAVSNDGYKQRDELNKKYLKLQENYYIYLKEKNEDVRKFKHDIMGHMVILKQYCVEGNCEEIDKYLDKIDSKIHISDKKITVSNGIVDAIINHYLYEAEKNGVTLEVEGHLYEECEVEPFDLCVIFANVLKNALEAAVNSEEKAIKLRLTRKDTEIELYMENSYFGERLEYGGEYKTTKSDVGNHGYGLRNANNSLLKYKGKMSVKAIDGKFYTYIFIPCVK